MQDSFGRKIEYLRVSVTDKCNLRCRYCMPQEGITRLAHDDILRLEEWARIIRIMQELGITKVRFTGGEPLVRKNLIQLIKDVHALDGISQIAMTTNGILLGEQAADLREAGLTHVNISLDTLNPRTFEEITMVDALNQVLSSIEKALQAGLQVKINCVPCQEWNGEDLTDIAALARQYPLDVRFIELMPVGCGREYHGISSDRVLEKLEQQYGRAVPVQANNEKGGPAKYYDFAGFQGKVGVISAMSHQFCGSCNRIRMTAEGRLKLCLHYQDGIELRPLLREAAGQMMRSERRLWRLSDKSPERMISHTRQSIQMQIREEWFKLGGSVKKPYMVVFSHGKFVLAAQSLLVTERQEYKNG